MQVCKVIWLDKDQKALNLPDEYILKSDLQGCMGVIGRRIYQSRHLIPEGAYGFVALPVDSLLNE